MTKTKKSKYFLIISALAIVIITLMVILLPNKTEPRLTSQDFSTSSVPSSSHNTSSSSRELITGAMTRLNLKSFDLQTKTFTGDFGSLALNNITKITEIYGDDQHKDQYLRLDFSLTNPSTHDLPVANLLQMLILQQDEGVFDKAERLEPIDADDYPEFGLDHQQTNLATTVKANTTVIGFIVYDLETDQKPVQFLLSTGEKVFEFQ